MLSGHLIVVFCFLVSFLTVKAQECSADGKLCDKHERCPVWKEEGECLRNDVYMKEECPASCAGTIKKTNKCEDLHPRCEVWAGLGECSKVDDVARFCPKACNQCTEDASCEDKHEKCAEWAKLGECTKNAKYMKVNCAKSCNTCGYSHKKRSAGSANSNERILEASSAYGVKQAAEGAEMAQTLKVIQKSTEYMKSDTVKSLSEKVRLSCENQHKLCAFWAVLGECEKNKAYMRTNCAPSCQSCHLIDYETRCPPLPDTAEPALKPGDLNRMFQRIIDSAPGNVTDPALTISDYDGPAYTVHVHSRPDQSAVSSRPSAAIDISNPPWVITFDNLLTKEEADDLVQLGYKYKYTRSEDVGERKFDGSHDSVQSTRRTSENAWCSSREGCRELDVPKTVQDRISTILRIPGKNSEDLQLLKYEKGQFYKTHHDYIPHQKDRQCGPRILTFFLYLSDVEEGGGTNFPKLDLTVEPKIGRGLLWPSVLNADPMNIDDRMKHQALEVVAGTKFAANGWIHMYDYVTPQESGCN